MKYIEAPVLSFCIPAYNAPEELTETLQSIVDAAKDYPIEVVIRDDASPSGDLWTVVEPFTNQLSINYQRHSKNLRFDANTLSAVAAARGEYCWLFSDNDWVLPYALDWFFAAIKRYPRAGYMYIDRLNEEDPVPPYDEMKGHGVPSAEEFITQNDVPGFISSQIVKKSLWDSVDKQKYIGNWWIHTATILEFLPKTETVRSQLPLIRARKGNAWVRTGNNLTTFLNLKKIMANIGQYGYSDPIVRHFQSQFARDLPEVLAYARRCGLKVTWRVIRNLIHEFYRYPLTLTGALFISCLPIAVLRKLKGVYSTIHSWRRS